MSDIKHSHYHKNVSDYDTIDVYVICDLYVKDNVKDLQGKERLGVASYDR